MAAVPSTGLAALEARFLAMRQVPADLESAFSDGFSVATGAAVGFAPLHTLRQAGQAVAAAMRAHPGKTAGLPYHNLHHFAEATLAMGVLCAIARGLALISPTDAALGVAAMIGHDIDHDGVSIDGGVLETHAAAETIRMSRAEGVGEDELARIAHIIEGTDPAALPDNEARMAGILPPGPFGAVGDRLRSLANEADVMASLMPKLGLQLGEALAAERCQAGDPNADVIASFTGRLEFLRRYGYFTPAAAALAIPRIVEAQIAAFAAAARALDAGATPEDGAAALDRMDRETACSRYLGEVLLP